METQEKIILRVSKGMLYNDEGVCVGVVTDDISEMEEKTIEASGEAVDALKTFVKDIETGTHKPKAAYNKFKALLEKYDL